MKKKEIELLDKISENSFEGLEIKEHEFIRMIDFFLEKEFVYGIKYEKKKILKIIKKDMGLTFEGKKYCEKLKE